MFSDEQKNEITLDINPRNMFVIPSFVKRALTCTVLNIDMNTPLGWKLIVRSFPFRKLIFLMRTISQICWHLLY
ncbi:hypothetical protein PUN28_004755 [Cardiocondyla obscurior]|uniref:Uncharacterized protein n=1 Tax=Cardiocondyla obscurior TaxID=286306 RepID=A0AAW2GCG4_9HYME